MVELYINNKWIFSTSMLGTPEEGGVGYWSDAGEMKIRDLKIFEIEPLK